MWDVSVQGCVSVGWKGEASGRDGTGSHQTVSGGTSLLCRIGLKNTQWKQSIPAAPSSATRALTQNCGENVALPCPGPSLGFILPTGLSRVFLRGAMGSVIISGHFWLQSSEKPSRVLHIPTEQNTLLQSHTVPYKMAGYASHWAGSPSDALCHKPSAGVSDK